MSVRNFVSPELDSLLALMIFVFQGDGIAAVIGLVTGPVVLVSSVNRERVSGPVPSGVE
jgi:hypothetical protein